MIQIATGKFFKGDESLVHQGHATFYSNYDHFFDIETSAAKFHSVQGDSGDYPTNIVVAYVNRMEKSPPSPGVLVRAGDKEIVESLRCLASFGLESYFSKDRNQVASLCRNGKYKILHLNHKRPVNHEDIQNFPSLVDKVLALPRKDFEIIDRCLKQYVHALEVSDANIDLAYSMYVYCLEALAQQYGSSFQGWDHYEPRAKEKLEKVFSNIESDKAEEIKAILLGSSHNRLKRRFVDFVCTTVLDSYFTSEAPSKAIPKSALKNALSKLYESRSGYVHELEPIQDQIRHNFIQGDFFVWDNEPYLTLNGVIRLTRHILLAMIHKLPSIEKEDFNWRTALPGIVTMQMSAEYWVVNVESYEKDQAGQRFTGFLTSVEEAIFHKKPILDIRPLFEKIETLTAQAKSSEKTSMICMANLFCAILPEGVDQDKKVFFENEFLKLSRQCSMEAMIVSSFSTQPQWSWSAEQSAEVFDRYLSQKTKPGKLAVPPLLQLGISILVANKFLEEGYPDQFKRRLLDARLEIPGYPKIQDKILKAIAEGKEVSIQELIHDTINEAVEK